MKVDRLNIVLLLLSFLFLHNSSSAYHHSSISYIGIEQGLSNNSVRCIYQDHNGFIWFGTYDGLNRYDGYQFKVFRNNLNDSSSLPHNYIYTINEDHHNNLWVGTGQGIGIYNNLTLKFLPAYYFPYRTKIKQKITSNVNAIKTDIKGNVFIGTNGWGLLLQNNGTNVAIQLSLKKGEQQTNDYNVRAIGIDQKQRVWLFILNVGLCIYDYADHKLQLVNNNIKSASCLEADEEDNLWVGNNNGLYKYSIAANSYIKLYDQHPGSLSSNNVACLSFDNQKNYGLGQKEVV